MKTLHWTKRVAADGSVLLADLPPQAEVEIVVVYPDPADQRANLERWFADVRRDHPFATLSKDEILAALRETREQVWNERNAHQP